MSKIVEAIIFLFLCFLNIFFKINVLQYLQRNVFLWSLCSKNIYKKRLDCLIGMRKSFRMIIVWMLYNKKLTKLFKPKRRKTCVFTRRKNWNCTPYLNKTHAPCSSKLALQQNSCSQSPNFGNLCCEYLLPNKCNFFQFWSRRPV